MSRILNNFVLWTFIFLLSFGFESEARTRWKTQIALTVYNYAYEDSYVTAYCDLTSYRKPGFPTRYRGHISLETEGVRCFLTEVPAEVPGYSGTVEFTNTLFDGKNFRILGPEEFKDELFRLASVTNTTSEQSVRFPLLHEKTVFRNIYIETGKEDASCYVAVRLDKPPTSFSIEVKASKYSPPELVCDAVPDNEQQSEIESEIANPENGYDACSTKKDSPYFVRMLMLLNDFPLSKLEKVTVDGMSVSYCVALQPFNSEEGDDTQDSLAEDLAAFETQNSVAFEEQPLDTTECKANVEPENCETCSESLRKLQVPVDSPIVQYLSIDDVDSAVTDFESNAGVRQTTPYRRSRLHRLGIPLNSAIVPYLKDEHVDAALTSDQQTCDDCKKKLALLGVADHSLIVPFLNEMTVNAALNDLSHPENVVQSPTLTEDVSLKLRRLGISLTSPLVAYLPESVLDNALRNSSYDSEYRERNLEKLRVPLESPVAEVLDDALLEEAVAAAESGAVASGESCDSCQAAIRCLGIPLDSVVTNFLTIGQLTAALDNFECDDPMEYGSEALSFSSNDLEEEDSSFPPLNPRATYRMFTDYPETDDVQDIYLVEESKVPKLLRGRYVDADDDDDDDGVVPHKKGMLQRSPIKIHIV